jgi:hypothetical protein
MPGGTFGRVVILEGLAPALVDQRWNDRGEEAADEEQSEGGDDGEACAVICSVQHW